MSRWMVSAAAAAAFVTLQACAPEAPPTARSDADILAGHGWETRSLKLGGQAMQIRMKVWKAGEPIPPSQLPLFDENGDGLLDSRDVTFAVSAGVRTWRWATPRTERVMDAGLPPLQISGRGALRPDGRPVELTAFETFGLAAPAEMEVVAGR